MEVKVGWKHGAFGVHTYRGENSLSRVHDLYPEIFRGVPIDEASMLQRASEVTTPDGSDQFVLEINS